MRDSSVPCFSLIKKSVFAIAVCSAMAGISPAMAAGTVVSSVPMHFVGAVTNTTCDVRPFNSAGIDATTFNIGNIAPDGDESTSVNLYLKPVNCGENPTFGTNATISWTSSGLSDHGLLNSNGTATGVFVKLMPIDEDNANLIGAGGVISGDIIREGNNTVYYKTTSPTKVDKPFAYKLSIKKESGATVTAGTIDADAIYSVSYQ